ncbi:MAG TPA: Gfo/Idh/MocA family oxidoreductase [Rubricoccaceae bacterium]
MPAPPASPLRLAVAGLTHSHVHGLLGRPDRGDVVLVGVSEPDVALARRYATRHGVDGRLFYTGLDEMLDAVQPEAVAAFGATPEHLAVVEACAPRGVHVMVEKPLADRLGAALRIRALADQHGVHVLTNYETTWYASVHAVRDILRSGAVGELRRVIAQDGHAGPHAVGVDPEFLAWLTDPEAGGGALLDFGCYGANLATWIADGAAPLTVTAVTQTLQPAAYPLVEDEATVVLTYPSWQAVVQASWNWPAGRKTLEVYGQTGYALAPDARTVRVRTDEAADETERTPEPRLDPMGDPFAFLAAVVRGAVEVAPADPSALDNNVTVVRILDAAREAAATGRTVHLRAPV